MLMVWLGLGASTGCDPASFPDPPPMSPPFNNTHVTDAWVDCNSCSSPARAPDCGSVVSVLTKRIARKIRSLEILKRARVTRRTSHRRTSGRASDYARATGAVNLGPGLRTTSSATHDPIATGRSKQGQCLGGSRGTKGPSRRALPRRPCHRHSRGELRFLRQNS